MPDTPSEARSPIEKEVLEQTLDRLQALQAHASLFLHQFKNRRKVSPWRLMHGEGCRGEDCRRTEYQLDLGEVIDFLDEVHRAERFIEEVKSLGSSET
jgi:hypothetical protein